ncbi:MAG TPA: cyclopropane fatty acyl phospholipid synthase [Gammaproteobacteria bacterium]|nr:cyclopropane fatty acyl phospholipid synthase [Gammaproteobacteria bacterium]
MLISNTKAIVKELLALADININGSRPWDIQVHDERVYEAVLRKKILGFGESYTEGWWDCAELDNCITRLVRAELEYKLKDRPGLKLSILANRLLNFQTRDRSLEVAQKHYDLGNDLFQCMLDENMMYSCGYWKSANNLTQAQIDKLELVCKKLNLAPGMRLLDIGCGWGGLAKFAAENYGVRVVGVTISQQQAELARQRCKDLPIEIRLQDYRELNEQFDRIASIGMFEHVGYKNYRHYMQVVKRCLAPEGLFLLHTLGSNISVVKGQNEWLAKYIFPNGMLPSIKQLGASFEKLFVMEDWQNFGAYYHPTLMSWHERFNQHWEQLKTKYGEQFRRLWNFYLLSCAGGLQGRDCQVWQIVLSHNGIDGVYHSAR